MIAPSEIVIPQSEMLVKRYFHPTPNILQISPISMATLKNSPIMIPA
jgi:hypothetical protein